MLCSRLIEGVRTMARPDFPRTLAEFRSRFVTEDDCRRYLVECRWPDGYRCPRCAHAEACELSTRELFQCRSCRHQVSVTAGTILHRTRVPLHLWFSAAYLVTTHTPGFSAVQLQRQLGLNRYETAWTMLQKLRRAMIRPERHRISGIVEVDETYVGGVEEQRRGGRQRDSNKSIVIAAVEVRGRGSGRIRLAVVEDLSAASLVPFVEASVAPGSTSLMDGKDMPHSTRRTVIDPPRWVMPRMRPSSLPVFTGLSRTSRPGSRARTTASARSTCRTTSMNSCFGSIADACQWLHSSRCWASPRNTHPPPTRCCAQLSQPDRH